MSAPILWILIPGLVAFVLFLLRRWSDVVIAGGIIVTGILTVLAWQLPIDAPLQLGPLTLKIADTLTILGRRFVLTDPDRPLLVLIYGIATLWFIASFFAQPGDLFIPVGLGIVGLLIAALAVSPFLFAALFIEIAALLSVPLLAAPGQSVRAGVMQFLIFQTLGAPFILFTGWLLAGVEASPADIDQVIRASILLGVGFAFLLGVIPFHTWILMMAEKTHPFRASFIYIMVLGLVSLFGLSFLDRFAWLRNSETLYFILNLVGLMMVVVGGLWASFQRHLGRIMGYAVVIEIGLALLATSVGGPRAMTLFFGLFPPRIFALLIWSVALTIVKRQQNGLTMEKLGGMNIKTPWVVAGLLCAQLSLAGLPLLAGFPVRLELFASLAAQNYWLAVGASFGTWGLLFAAGRTIHAMYRYRDDEPMDVGPERLQDGFFMVGIALLVLFGIFPNLPAPAIDALTQAFQNLVR